jgi:hypothetical protein
MPLAQAHEKPQRPIRVGRQTKRRYVALKPRKLGTRNAQIGETQPREPGQR